MLTLETVKAQAASHKRVMIRPKVEVHTRTAENRQQVVDAARRVIAEHRDVLLALKNR